MDNLLNQIANLGFPIVLSIYLLVRVEGKLEKLSESINELSKVIASFKG
ncbi:YvrJ protein family protein [Caloramator fervidus]|uniref:YvrJ protein family protein n=1 Tax=Caloramator fervidus TaxID=29344 RepID=A0A1H5RM05_9CLOT|nr:YvrJ family protein [Caloramator fervidus]SEF39389.1 YvrJ protein family protein [Caloramator fervidus]